MWAVFIDNGNIFGMKFTDIIQFLNRILIRLLTWSNSSHLKYETGAMQNLFKKVDNLSFLQILQFCGLSILFTH